MALLWCCFRSFLVLLWLYSGAASAVMLLLWSSCTGAGFLLFMVLLWLCSVETGDVLALLWSCSGDYALVLLFSFSGIALARLPLFWRCSAIDGVVLALPWCCSTLSCATSTMIRFVLFLLLLVDILFEVAVALLWLCFLSVMALLWICCGVAGAVLAYL